MRNENENFVRKLLKFIIFLNEIENLTIKKRRLNSLNV